MGSKNGSADWADQWGSHDIENANFRGQEDETGKSNRRFAEYEKKMKVVASTGYEKAKFAASVGAQKVKEGTTTGYRWIMDRYQKRSAK
ncbi:hypothetical protein O6H91_13G022900 [Diphasiastrum complanatum]|uniref:Uncharacterized protein n=1 Tax=Diphasiastrum complanatum TaxID=34168 RepID=A0ACC2BTW5_DIPCM|nr:hypothetical protein O6H91_13G022900 [Diphasiastrum complanatum]